FDWNRTATKVVIHDGGADPEDEQVAMMSVSEGDQSVDRVLNKGFAPFKTPCWSPDGSKLAYVGATKDRASLYLAAPDGSSPHAMVTLEDGLTSFEWMSDSRHIVYSTSDKPPENVFDGLSLADVTTSKSRKLTSDPVLAYFISPNSRY